MKTLAILAAAAVTSAASAGVVGFVGDTTLAGGWYAFDAASGADMVPYVHGGSYYEEVSAIGGDFGDLLFDASHSLRWIGSGWATWSHGYTGEVFYNNGLYDTGYSMPGGVGAFDAYIEPNPFSEQYFTITGYGSDGSSTTIDVVAHGSAGASHFGFYTTGGEELDYIMISGSADWAIGEFRLAAVPAPGALALFGLLGLTRRRR